MIKQYRQAVLLVGLICFTSSFADERSQAITSTGQKAPRTQKITVSEVDMAQLAKDSEYFHKTLLDLEAIGKKVFAPAEDERRSIESDMKRIEKLKKSSPALATKEEALVVKRVQELNDTFGPVIKQAEQEVQEIVSHLHELVRRASTQVAQKSNLAVVYEKGGGGVLYCVATDQSELIALAESAKQAKKLDVTKEVAACVDALAKQEVQAGQK